jgi:16S rRNA (uracil1498-N3)-methyltransferase
MTDSKQSDISCASIARSASVLTLSAKKQGEYREISLGTSRRARFGTLAHIANNLWKLDSKDGKKKAERWGKIAESAAKQSGRGIIPLVSEPLDFKIAIEDATKASLAIFCNERETEKTLKSILCQKGYDDISIIIGSEGGFSQREADYITEKGAKSVTLGKRILRCETAPTFVLSAIAYETEME